MRDNRRRREREDSREKRRDRSRSRDLRDHSRSRSRSGSRSRSKTKEKARKKKHTPEAPMPVIDLTEMDGKSEEEIAMMKMMGFSGFNTTKGKVWWENCE